jgi:hypothetical protein
MWFHLNVPAFMQLSLQLQCMVDVLRLSKLLENMCHLKKNYVFKIKNSLD